MEIVSSKLEMKGLVASTRVERKDASAPPPRRWNGASNSTSQSTGTLSRAGSNQRQESTTTLGSGKSLLSLKAYYRKLRVFKGTVKALINLRRFPVLAKAASTGSGSDAEQNGLHQRRPTALIGRISMDDEALQTVQSQVKNLVDEGHVITEQNEDVTYRLQGDLEHYTKDNLRKRAALETHPHMIALTQRLWLSAVQDDDHNLIFSEYEAYMLRLHRLILPEFDLNASKELIHDDWERDANGAEHLDYRFFHLSMFELVDLWTDTVEPEDYISLLYCIMHSLTFAWNAKFLLKPLEDVHPIDILEASKAVSMDEISRDLEAEVNSAAAQMFRDRLTILEKQHPGGDVSSDKDVAAEPLEALREETLGCEQSEVRRSNLDQNPLSLENKVGSAPAAAPAAKTGTSKVTKATSPRPVERGAPREKSASKRPQSSDAAVRKRSASRVSSSRESDATRKLNRLSSANSRFKERNSQQFETSSLKTSTVFDPLADLQPPLGSASSHFDAQSQVKSGLSSPVKKGSLSGVVLNIGNMDGSEFANMVSRPSFVLKSTAVGRPSINNGSGGGATGRGGINWRDFYQEGTGAGDTGSMDGVSGQGALRGNKFDFGQIQHHQSGTLSPRKSVSGSMTKTSMPSTSEYLRINQAYVASQVQQKEQQLSSFFKADEQRDGAATVMLMEPLSIGSTPLTPRSLSATFKRSSPQFQSPRSSNAGAYNLTQFELNGTRMNDSPAMGSRLGSLSITPSSNNNSHSPDRQSSIHLSTRQHQQQQLSPRLSRIYQQQQLTGTSTPPLVGGLVGLTITSAHQPTLSSSPPKSPQRSADGTSLSVSPGRAAPPNLTPLDLIIGANPSPRPGLSHATSIGAPALPARQQHQPSTRKMSQHHPRHQYQQLQQPGSTSSRKSMLVDNSKQIQQQVQQQFGAGGGGLDQISAQSVPISPRKQ